jgi:hypothetical protein
VVQTDECLSYWLCHNGRASTRLEHAEGGSCWLRVCSTRQQNGECLGRIWAAVPRDEFALGNELGMHIPAQRLGLWHMSDRLVSGQRVRPGGSGRPRLLIFKDVTIAMTPTNLAYLRTLQSASFAARFCAARVTVSIIGQVHDVAVRIRICRTLVFESSVISILSALRQ